MQNDVQREVFLLEPSCLWIPGSAYGRPGMTASELADHSRGILKPSARLGIEMWADLLTHSRMIRVEPRDLVRRHDRRLHEAQVDGREGQRLEAHHLAVAAGDRPRLDEDEVFDADAVGAGLVEAGL